MSDSDKTSQTTTALIKDIFFVGAFFLIFTTFAFASFHIPSGSMEPTLEVGDRLMVSKYSYGYNKYSVYFNPDFVGEDRLFEDKPERGDVVVFTLPYRDNIDFIKRVIGLPGDRVQVRQGRLYINGQIVPRDFIRNVQYTDARGYERRVKEYTEKLPGGVEHLIYERTDDGFFDNTAVFTVPENHYFMMGDNRDGSNDSRNMGEMGMVDQKYLVGKAQVTTFSLYDCDQGKPVSCKFGIPFGRFFNGIE